MKARLFLARAMSLSLGCQFKAPTSPTGKPKPGATTSAPAASARVVDFADLDANAPVKIAGLARIISDNGLGIISNNSGSIISDNGLGLISNNGVSYRVAATATPE